MTATELALDMLRGESQRYLTVKQVVYLASIHRRETGEGFQQPDYTILQYNGTGDGWELFRMANGAGILKRVSHEGVLNSGAKRRRQEVIERMAGELNDLFEQLMTAGVNPRESADWVQKQEEYRAFCRS